MFECYCCRHRAVYWNSDADAEDAGYTEAGIVSFYTCGNCGAEIEMFIPIKEERDETED